MHCRIAELPNCRIALRACIACILLAGVGSGQNNTEVVNGTRVWRDRYDNCDHAYQVLLPKGVVAQSGASSAPNHGFAISVADPATPKPFSLGAARIVQVYDALDVQDLGSPRAYFDQYDNEAPDGVTPVVRAIRETRFAGLPALYVRFGQAGPQHMDETEQIIAYRKSAKNADATFFVFFLRSTPKDFVKDHAMFLKIQQGFRLMQVAETGCSSR